MLTPEQQKLIRKLYVLPKLVAPSFLMIFGSIGVSVLLFIIDGAFLRNLNPSLLTIFLSCIASVFYGIFTLYAGLSGGTGLHSEKWRTLVTEVAARNYLMPTTDSFYEEKMAELCASPEAVAKLARMELPSVKRARSLLILIPLLLQVLVFAPQFIRSYQALNEQREATAAVIDQLNAAFSPVCEEIHYDDPRENYRYSRYSFYAYLPATEDIEDPYIWVVVDSDGRIHEVSYYFDVNIQLTKEENMAYAKQSFETLHKILVASGVSTSSKAQMEVYDLSDAFWTAFMDGTYYDEISIDSEEYDDAYLFYNYYTDPQEEFDEYTQPYISLRASTRYSKR